MFLTGFLVVLGGLCGLLAFNFLRRLANDLFERD